MTDVTTAPTIRVGALPPAATNLLTAVLEAIDLPYPASMGWQEAHDRILNERVMHAKLALRSVLDGNSLGLDWDANYLREKLAQHPVQGYVTTEQAHAAMAEGKSWSEAVTLPIEPEPRCPAAHSEDPTPCVGPVVVTVLDRENAGADGCAHHAVRLLASLTGGQPVAKPDAPDGIALQVFRTAGRTRPFPWLTDAPRTRFEQLSDAENHARGEGR
ncbi:hypothetical protein AB0L59_30085 [Streptomyces sp. NPDC052109]|uniref:hypothetical protein n=1 Tax=Streptomyces sp. NPDC052109 TaxID=3155527 RepID=UPI00342ACB15